MTRPSPPAQVRCGGKLFEMHASVVTCGSDYFRAMLEHPMVERESRAFELHEVQAHVLERVVEWLYSGEVGEISGVAEGLALLEGSRFLRVERLEALCVAWLCAHVEASNCVALWAEANRLGCGLVAEHALLVMGRQLAAVAGEVDFLGLPLEALLELVRSDGLAVRSELAVYEAVMGWVRHDAGARTVWLGEVLGAVRMALPSPPYSAGTVDKDLLVMGTNRCGKSTGAERATAVSSGLFCKRKHDSGGELVVVGGKGGIINGDSLLKSAEWYDRSTGKWWALPEMSVARSGCAAVGVEGDVYVVGGQGDGRAILKSAEMYSGSTGRWWALPDMSVERSGCAGVCVKGNVYVVGGHGGTSHLKSAEMYDTSMGEWRALPDMSTERWEFAAVSVEENVYVMGGYDGVVVAALKSVEMHNTSTGQWAAVPEMSVARYGCAAVCAEGNIYVMGGHDGFRDLKCAEMYDKSAGQWRALPDMRVARYGCAALYIDGKVCVMGGQTGATNHASVEWYDPIVKEWHELPSMGTARWCCAAAAGDIMPWVSSSAAAE